ncbi:O-antigen ligase [Rhizobium sp. RU20A]|uniref:O-antigen ligase family protein n=1 Tax=Rhizobium sp. RU20A TaxID=1907412 RepID=UPI00095507E3|nr:O-antigen ligase family protein [Rhizobium sp. RU20A]SIP95685.1 O-antigen ligase [Rhizobium sp. RU20A]
MTDSAADIRPFRPQLAAVTLAGSMAVAFGVLLSGFVMSEPAPYELYMAGLITIWALFGLRISRRIAPLLALLITFNIGGMLSLTVMEDLDAGPMYVAVSAFLALTSVFYAAIIEERHERLALIFRAWVAAAVITAMLGILGYFGLIPGGAAFTRYDRAMGAFQDPNVFGPFLVPPSLFLIRGLLTDRLSRAPLKVAGLLITTLGIFLSFSRAAWGLYALCVVALVLIMVIKERSGAFRLKVLMLTLSGFLGLIVTLGIALETPQVSAMLSQRTQLVQSYDGGHLGRFERHRIGFLMAMEKPLGIGPMEFSKIFPEDEHNIWLKSLTSYGWLGFLCYFTLIIWSVSMGFRFLLLDRPWQPYLMIAWISLVGHTCIGFVIDTDHWRHFYMLLGILWGTAALEYRHRARLARNQRR